jgi:ubiquinol-cytochrome c reductase cytochrome c1 subunit
MIRLGALIVGLVFVAATLWGAVQPRAETPDDPAKALHKYPQAIAWSFNGPTGTFDRAQLQRGFQVYKEVCSACHTIRLVAFRDLADLGFSQAEVKAIAAGYEVPTIDSAGEPTTRKATPADKFPLLYPNEAAARAAQNGALPPDLSLMTKARADGSNYVAALLNGYADAPQGWLVPDGLYYNPYFHSINIAMPPPIAADDQVTYADGTKATKKQMAEDVSAFLTWTAEPKMEVRKQTGLGAILFLLIMTGLGYLSYRKVWADVKGKKGVVPAE